MSANYTAPGVYIEEIASGSRPIEAVGTSTVGFIGAAPKAEQQIRSRFPDATIVHLKEPKANPQELEKLHQL